ncbi:MAG: arginine deiminase family protein [Lysobacterales bacterium]
MKSNLPHALVREVSASLADCQLSFVDRAPIDVDLSRRQHRAYKQALVDAGCTLVSMPAEDQMPDAVFVEDTVLVLDELAVMTRPGAVSRRSESASVAEVIGRYRPLLWIDEPGTLDGGDILRIGRDIYVGASARSNDTAVAQLRKAVLGYGYRVHQVAIQGCLHLKSAVTQISDDTLLVQPQWLVDAKVFAGYRRIEVDPAEGHAANALRIGRSVVYPSCFPRTQARIESIGVEVHAVDVSELQKAEGAVTCCSVLFRA